jgi:hypothetical protein
VAVYKGVAYVTVNNGTGNRHFALAHATGETTPDIRGDHTSFEQDAAADGSVALVLTQSTDGLTPPSTADSVTVELLHADSATVLDAATIAPGEATSTALTLSATSDGAATGTPLIGDCRLRLRVVRTSLGTYDADSDSQNLKGFLRLNPASLAVTAGHTGASDPASFGDELTATVDLSHSPGVDLPHRHFDVTARNAATDVAYASGRTTGLDPQSVALEVDNRFPASEVGVNIDVEVVAVPSAIAPDSEPLATWIVIPVGTVDRVDGKKVRKGQVPTDAGISIGHHLQVNDDVRDAAKAVTSRMVSELGFLAARLANARGEPVAGITYRATLTDERALLAPAIDRTVTTGVDGWPSTLVPWDSQLPGGSWEHTVAITAPANATGLEANPTAPRTLLAANPNLVLVCGAGPAQDPLDARHLTPGMPVLAGLVVFDVASRRTVALDEAGIVPSLALGRFNVSLGRAEHLDADGTWQPTSDVDVHYWTCTKSAGDANVWIVAFTETSSWGHADLFTIGRAAVGGVTVSSFGKEPVVGAVNNHTGYVIDGPGLLGFPTR